MNSEVLEDWVEDEFDPEEETPAEFVRRNDFPNPAAVKIALKRAQEIRKTGPEPTAEEQLDDELPVSLDVRAGRLREPSGRFIGWVEAAIKYIKRLGGL